MTDSWQDTTGSIERPEKSLVTPNKHLDWVHESEEITTLRRARSLEAIFSTIPSAQFKENGLYIQGEIYGKKFDFYPASDCYYIHSTQRFGHDIEKICKQIKRKLG